MMSIFFFFFLFSLCNGLTIEQPKPPKYIIIASRQRSSSSTLNRMVSSHSCVLHGNEIWTRNHSQDNLGAHDLVNMSDEEIRQYPNEFLLSAYDEICNNARINGDIPSECETCTIAIKMFDIHGLGDNVISLIEDPDFEFVVLERPVQGQYCSWKRAKIYGDWATVPGNHKTETTIPVDDCVIVPYNFKEKSEKWYRMLRTELKRTGRFYTEVPFETVSSCKLSNLMGSIYSQFGLSLGQLNLPSDLEDLFTDC